MRRRPRFHRIWIKNLMPKAVPSFTRSGAASHPKRWILDGFRRFFLVFLCSYLFILFQPAWGRASSAMTRFDQNLVFGPYKAQPDKLYAKRPDDRQNPSNPLFDFKGRSKPAPQYQEWQSLPPQDKDLLRRRMDEYRSLPPAQQELYRQRWRQWQQMSPEEKRRVESDLQRWNQLSPEEREAIRRLFQR